MRHTAWATTVRGDYGAADWADPDIEYVVVDGPSPGSTTGLAGLADAMRMMFSDIKDLRAKAEEYRELDDDRVLALTYLTGRGKASGISVGQRGAEVFQVREGKVTRVDVWFDRSRALVDLCLAPEAGN